MCRYPGLSSIFLELFNYENMEIYVESKDRDGREMNFDGIPFKEILNRFANSTVIGVQRLDGATDEEQIILDPPVDFVMRKGDRIIHVAEDDRELRLTETAPEIIRTALRDCYTPLKKKKMNMVILDWNKGLPVILRNLDDLVLAGSSVIIASERPYTQIDILNESLKNIHVDFVQRGNLHRDQFLEGLVDAALTNILILCQEDEEASKADARVMLLLLHVRDIIERREQECGSLLSTIVTSELHLPYDQKLMYSTRVNDIIVGSEIANRVMTQTVNQPALKAVFAELLRAEGAEVYLRPIERYLEIDGHSPVQFAELVELCYAHRDLVIGWMSRDEELHTHYVLNPAKTEIHVFQPGEELIVISQG